MVGLESGMKRAAIMYKKGDSNFERGLSKWLKSQGEDAWHYHPNQKLDDILESYSISDGTEEDATYRPAVKAFSAIAIRNAFGLLECAESLCESPIEKQLMFALLIAAHATQHVVTIHHRFCSPESWGFFGGCGPETLVISPQAQIGEHRVDFLIEREDYEPSRGGMATLSKLVVECDGHDFHEKTKEQARKDKSRDRTLQSCGYPVFRFTGAEIFQDVFKCIADILSFLIKKSEEETKRMKQRATNP